MSSSNWKKVKQKVAGAIKFVLFGESHQTNSEQEHISTAD
jgi:hypothetical protein